MMTIRCRLREIMRSIRVPAAFPTPPWATMRKKITIVLMVMTGLSFTGLPTLAATAVWTLIFTLQQGG